VRIAGQEVTRQEVFSLLRSDAAEWLIDAWHSEPLSGQPTAVRPKS
jgi:hypothetical protein